MLWFLLRNRELSDGIATEFNRLRGRKIELSNPDDQHVVTVDAVVEQSLGSEVHITEYRWFFSVLRFFSIRSIGSKGAFVGFSLGCLSLIEFLQQLGSKTLVSCRPFFSAENLRWSEYALKGEHSRLLSCWS